MSDERILEKTLEHEQLIIDASIQKIRGRSEGYQLPPIGRCHACGEFFSEKTHEDYDTKRFCNTECLDEWEDYHKSQLRKFGPNIKPSSAF